MARFFFDVHDGVEIRDNGGTELPDMAAARAHAIDLAAHFAREAVIGGSEATAVVVNVRDAAQTIILTVRQVVDIRAAEAGNIPLAG